MIRRIREAITWRWWYLRTPLGRGVLSRLHRYPSVFESWRDVLVYARSILYLNGSAPALELRVKQLRGKILRCRPATSDPWVLWDVFYHKFQQLPPDCNAPITIVDAGANVGYTTAYYASEYPNARILAVEMDQANYELALFNTDSFGDRCRVVHAAVWDRDGRVDYQGTEQQGYRVSACDDVGTGQAQARTVESRTLSSLFDEYRVDEVDFLKMDIEGAEAVVLRDRQDWLARVRCLKIEFHPPMSADECAAILRRNGFVCRRDTDHDHCLIAIRETAGKDSETLQPKQSTKSAGGM
jgi:FkbM family methyltransferase